MCPKSEHDILKWTKVTPAAKVTPFYGTNKCINSRKPNYVQNQFAKLSGLVGGSVILTNS